MKILLSESQLRKLIEQPESRFGPEQFMSQSERQDFRSGNPERAGNALMGGSNKQMAYIHSLDPHTLLTITEVASVFIPVVGNFISISAGLGNAAIYYKEGDKKMAAITAVLSMLPLVGDIPGVKETIKQLGTKGMVMIASKLGKGAQLTEQEIQVLNAIAKNQNLVKSELTAASKTLSGLESTIKELKPNYVSKFGLPKYEELSRNLFSKKIAKEEFISQLKTAGGDTYKLANMSVKGGVKFLQTELKGISDLVPPIKNGSVGKYYIKLNVKGNIKNVEVFVGNFPKKTWKGLASPSGNKIYMNLSELEGATEQEIRQTLYHEATHIKDPSNVSPKFAKSYDDVKKARDVAQKDLETAYAKVSEPTSTLGDIETTMGKSSKVKDLYKQYLYHPQEIISNNQMILNNMTSELDGVIQSVGPNGAKQALDNLIGYSAGKNKLSKEGLELMGEIGDSHLKGLYQYNKDSYKEFLKKLAKQSEFLKSQLNLM